MNNWFRGGWLFFQKKYTNDSGVPQETPHSRSCDTCWVGVHWFMRWIIEIFRQQVGGTYSSFSLGNVITFWYIPRQLAGEVQRIPPEVVYFSKVCGAAENFQALNDFLVNFYDCNWHLDLHWATCKGVLISPQWDTFQIWKYPTGILCFQVR